jgi:hypothetical protein
MAKHGTWSWNNNNWIVIMWRGTQNQQQCKGIAIDYKQGINDGPMQQCKGIMMN